jgi:hypothetical protein
VAADFDSVIVDSPTVAKVDAPSIKPLRLIVILASSDLFGPMAGDLTAID